MSLVLAERPAPETAPVQSVSADLKAGDFIPDPHVVMRGVTKRFDNFQALAGIDLAIGRGEMVTLLGPSGCGKTTLLRTVAGFLRSDSGSISVGGKVIDAAPPHKRNFGMVFQSYAIFPHLSVSDNVAYGLKARGVSPSERGDRVRRALDRVQLGALKDRFPDALSGGQKQRVGLARAMVIEPELLLMDEPLSNLDAKLRIDMRQEIRLMQRELGITTLYVTHDQEEAMAISDRVAVMHEGKLQQVASPEEIYDNPVNAYVAEFIGGCNWFDGILTHGPQGSTLQIGGEKPMKLAQSIEAAGPVRMGLRVDDFELADAGAGDLTAIVLVRSYLGPRTRLRLRHITNQTLFDIDLPSGSHLPREGQTIGLRFGAERLRLFAGADGSRIL